MNTSLPRPLQVSAADATLTCHLCGCAYDAAHLHPVRVMQGWLTLAATCRCCSAGRLVRVPVPSHWHLADLHPEEVWHFLLHDADADRATETPSSEEWQALLL